MSSPPIRRLCRLTLWHRCGSSCFNINCYSVAFAQLVVSPVACHHNMTSVPLPNCLKCLCKPFKSTKDGLRAAHPNIQPCSHSKSGQLAKGSAALRAWGSFPSKPLHSSTLEQAAGHLRWKVSCPPSQPVGSGFVSHWRLTTG